MVGKAKVFTDDSSNLVSLQRNKLANYAIGRDNPDLIGATQFNNSESSGISSIGGINSDKTKLPLEGGLIRGNIGFEIATIRLVTGTNVCQLDEDGSGVKIPQVHDTNILTLDVGTTGTLTTIKGAMRDGQRLRLLGVAGNVVTITHTVAVTTDTITCPDNTDQTLSNDEVVDLVYEKISDTLGRWRMLANGAGGGGTSFIAFTADADLNMGSFNITGQDDTTQTIGDSTHRWLEIWVSSMRLDSDHSFTLSTSGATLTLNGGANSYTITIDTLQRLLMTSSLTTLSGNVDILGELDVGEFIDINEQLTPADPAANVGRTFVKDVAGDSHLFYVNSTEVEVDLSAGGAAANQQLSNLSGTVNVNLDLLPNQATGGNLGSASASKQWVNIYVDRLRVFDKIIFDDTGTITTTQNEILRTSASVVEHNVPAGGIFRFKQGGALRLLIEPTQTILSSDITAIQQTSAIPHLFIDRLGSTTDDLEIGRITYSALDSAGAFHEWARISGHIVDNLSTDREGMLKLEVSTGASDELEVYITLNASESGITNFEKRAAMLLLGTVHAEWIIGRGDGNVGFDGATIGETIYKAPDDAGTISDTEYVNVITRMEDISNGTEDGSLEVQCRTAGTQATVYSRYNRFSNAIMQFQKSMAFNGTKLRIGASSGNVMGHFAGDSTSTVGDKGTVQIPFHSAAGAISSAQANTQFGSMAGAVGVYRNTTSGEVIFLVNDDQTNWKFEILTTL